MARYLHYFISIIIYLVAYAVLQSANAQSISNTFKIQSLYKFDSQIQNNKDNNNKNIDISFEKTMPAEIHPYRKSFFTLISFTVLISITLFFAFKYYQNIQLEQRKAVDQLVHKVEELSQHQSSQKEEEKDKYIQELIELANNRNPIFFTKFNQYFPEFSRQLMTVSSFKLVAKEIEICAMLILNFDTKEIAYYTNSTTRSVESRKYRIRKKLQVPSSEDLTLWMQLKLPERLEQLRSQSVSLSTINLIQMHS
ncbi:hypothetical protein FAZ15_17540 [Sphingobacterium olei]|uniref:HTH luxR-type domain-containing protein n=1 Tax=Sphingobacterium olei TaxID=2571155 RepID=A0A4U0NGS4_9SPHI|nr:LuxR C-terminal-related transcriptional regulator [Sphingobacterium olei]TJZ53163.1 hypothetical protein FAZ15_17540 [Sphingobacterium olei]